MERIGKEICRKYSSTMTFESQYSKLSSCYVTEAPTFIPSIEHVLDGSNVKKVVDVTKSGDDDNMVDEDSYTPDYSNTHDGEEILSACLTMVLKGSCHDTSCIYSHEESDLKQFCAYLIHTLPTSRYYSPSINTFKSTSSLPLQCAVKSKIHEMDDFIVDDCDENFPEYNCLNDYDNFDIMKKEIKERTIDESNIFPMKSWKAFIYQCKQDAIQNFLIVGALFHDEVDELNSNFDINIYEYR